VFGGFGILYLLQINRMAQPLVVQAAKLFLVDLVGGVLGFPVWWYSKGVVRWSRFMWDWYETYRATLAVDVWVKNWFVPMYGSYDIPGRLISFFMRTVMIVLRSLLLLLVSCLMIIIYCIYFILPPIVVVAIVYNAYGLFL